MHLDLQVEDELATVEELPQRLLRVELLRNLNVYLLGDLLQLCDPRIFNQTVPWRPTQGVCVVCCRDRQRVFVVFENQSNDVIDGVDGLVDLVIL